MITRKDCIYCNECTQDIFAIDFIIFGYDAFLTKQEAEKKLEGLK